MTLSENPSISPIFFLMGDHDVAGQRPSCEPGFGFESSIGTKDLMLLALNPFLIFELGLWYSATLRQKKSLLKTQSETVIWCKHEDVSLSCGLMAFDHRQGVQRLWPLGVANRTQAKDVNKTHISLPKLVVFAVSAPLWSLLRPDGVGVLLPAHPPRLGDPPPRPHRLLWLDLVCGVEVVVRVVGVVVGVEVCWVLFDTKPSRGRGMEKIRNENFFPHAARGLNSSSHANAQHYFTTATLI